MSARAAIAALSIFAVFAALGPVWFFWSLFERSAYLMAIPLTAGLAAGGMAWVLANLGVGAGALSGTLSGFAAFVCCTAVVVAPMLAEGDFALAGWLSLSALLFVAWYPLTIGALAGALLGSLQHEHV